MLTRKLDIFLFVFAICLIALLIPYVPYLMLILIIALFLVLYKTKFILLFVIVVFIAFTSFAFNEARAVVNILAVSSLLYLFLKKFGLQISEYPKIPPKMIYFFIFLFVTFIISTLGSASVAVSSFTVLRTAIFFVICYLFFSLIENKETIYIYIFGIIAAEILIGSSVLFDFIKAGFGFHLNNGVLARYAGIYDNPNVVGLTACMATSFILVLFFIERFSSRKYKLIFSFLLFLNALVFIITDSRAATIALIISSSFILYILNRKLLKRLTVSVLIVIIILFLIPIVQEAFLILLRLSDANSRNDIWMSGLQVFKHHMIFGIGPGMYPNFAFTNFSSHGMLMLKLKGELFHGRPSPHNFFLLMACENGILGLVFAISIFSLFFYYAYKCLKGYKNLDKEIYILTVAIFGIGLGAFERAFFEVSGIMAYGYLTQDLPFWLAFFISIFNYQKLKKRNILN